MSLTAAADEIDQLFAGFTRKRVPGVPGDPEHLKLHPHSPQTGKFVETPDVVAALVDAIKKKLTDKPAKKTAPKATKAAAPRAPRAPKAVKAAPAKKATPAKAPTKKAVSTKKAVLSKALPDGTAKRGDLVVVETTDSYADGGHLNGVPAFRVAKVVSVTKDGKVKAFVTGDDPPRRVEHLPRDHKLHVVSADHIDVDAALVTARDNPWPHAPEHKGKAYDSLDEVREALRPHLKVKERGSSPKSVLSPPTGRFELAEDRGQSGDGRAPGGQWGRYGAAGVLVRSTDGDEPRFLLLKTGAWVDAGGKWQLPGGALDEHENPYQGVAREAHEEIGVPEDVVKSLRPVGEHVYQPDPDWRYTTIAADVDTPFEVRIDGDETTDAKWFTVAEIDQMLDDDVIQKSLKKTLRSIIDSYPKAKPAKKPRAPKAKAAKAAGKADVRGLAGVNGGLLDADAADGFQRRLDGGESHSAVADDIERYAANDGLPAQHAWGRIAARLRANDPNPPAADVQAGRIRQAKLDSAREVAGVLTELDELHASKASPRALEHRLRARARQDSLPQDMTDALIAAGISGDRKQIDKAIDRLAAEHGLTRISARAGSVEPFDPRTHEMLGDSTRVPGGAVLIVRPGYAVDVDGERVQVSRAAVLPATPEQAAAAVPVKKAVKAATKTAAKTKVEGGGRDLLALGSGPLATKLVKQAGVSGLAPGQRPQGPHGDELLHHIALEQGWTDRPRQVDHAEFDRLIADGRPELFRGVETRAEVDRLVTGEPYFGDSVYGSGINATSDRPDALMYGDHVVRMTFAPDTRIVDLDEVQADQARFWSARTQSADQRLVFGGDSSRFAAARGIDVIRIRRQDDGEVLDVTEDPAWLDAIAGTMGYLSAAELPDGVIAELQRMRGEHYLVLNRGVLVVDTEPAGLVTAREVPSSRSAQSSFTRADEPHTGAMVALVPTAEDAKRLAVDDGLPVNELHCTLFYLGDATDFPAEPRKHLVELVRGYFTDAVLVEADGFALSLFNPGGDEPCITLGVSGEGVENARRRVLAAVEDYGADLPEQHQPWHAHLTLAYTDDLAMVGELVGRTGPVTFDRVRVAFGGGYEDIPLGSESNEPLTDTDRAAFDLATRIASRAGFKPNQPRDPGGEGGGQWIHIGGKLFELLDGVMSALLRDDGTVELALDPDGDRQQVHFPASDGTLLADVLGDAAHGPSDLDERDTVKVGTDGGDVSVTSGDGRVVLGFDTDDGPATVTMSPEQADEVAGTLRDFADQATPATVASRVVSEDLTVSLGADDRLRVTLGSSATPEPVALTGAQGVGIVDGLAEFKTYKPTVAPKPKWFGKKVKPDPNADDLAIVASLRVDSTTDMDLYADGSVSIAARLDGGGSTDVYVPAQDVDAMIAALKELLGMARDWRSLIRAGFDVHQPRDPVGRWVDMPLSWAELIERFGDLVDERNVGDYHIGAHEGGRVVLSFDADTPGRRTVLRDLTPDEARAVGDDLDEMVFDAANVEIDDDDPPASMNDLVDDTSTALRPKPMTVGYDYTGDIHLFAGDDDDADEVATLSQDEATDLANALRESADGADLAIERRDDREEAERHRREKEREAADLAAEREEDERLRLEEERVAAGETERLRAEEEREAAESWWEDVLVPVGGNRLGMQSPTVVEVEDVAGGWGSTTVPVEDLPSLAAAIRDLRRQSDGLPEFVGEDEDGEEIGPEVVAERKVSDRLTLSLLEDGNMTLLTTDPDITWEISVWQDNASELADALERLLARIRATPQRGWRAGFKPGQPRVPSHPGMPNPSGGEWVKLLSGGPLESLLSKRGVRDIAKALDLWASGGGDDKPLAGFSDGQLRRAARAQGIPHGGDREAVEERILDEVRRVVSARRAGHRDRPSYSFGRGVDRPQARDRDGRLRDVEIHQTPGGVSVVLLDSRGQRVSTAVAVKDFTQLRAWAKRNKLRNLAGWIDKYHPTTRGAKARRQRRINETVDQLRAALTYDAARAQLDGMEPAEVTDIFTQLGGRLDHLPKAPSGRINQRSAIGALLAGWPEFARAGELDPGDVAVADAAELSIPELFDDGPAQGVPAPPDAWGGLLDWLDVTDDERARDDGLTRDAAFEALHPRYKKPHPKAGKFMSKADIAMAIADALTGKVHAGEAKPATKKPARPRVPHASKAVKATPVPAKKAAQAAEERAAARAHVGGIIAELERSHPDLREEDRAVIGAIHAALDRQAELVPRTVMHLHGVGFLPESGFGSYQPAYNFGTSPMIPDEKRYGPGQQIWLNRKWVTHRRFPDHDATRRYRAELEEKFVEVVRKGWFPGSAGADDPMTYVVSHETGHHLQRMLAFTVPAYGLGGREHVEERFRPAVLRPLLTALDTHMGTTFMADLDSRGTYRERAGLVVSMDYLDGVAKKHGRKLTKDVSGYGGSGKFDELLGEVWGRYSMEGDTAPDPIRQVAMILQRLAEQAAKKWTP